MKSVIERVIATDHRVKELSNSVAIPRRHSLFKDGVNILVEALLAKR